MSTLFSLSKRKEVKIKQGGMTLLEVMLALVILATSGLAVMRSASSALNNQAYLQEKSIALWVASNKLVELKLEKKMPRASWKKEKTKMANVQWYLRYKTVDTGDDSFKALDIEVSDKEDGKALAYLRTYLTSKKSK
ncbi:MAG TPA: type II secretion system protein GspI [Psychromonas hadalis]|nr:type II secretion system protein GspI [Psychromonas hadalis]